MEQHQDTFPRSHSDLLTSTKRKWMLRWLVTWLLLRLHVVHVTANVSFASGMVRLNKTHLDEINKRAWLNKLSKMLELANSDNAPPPGGLTPQHGDPTPASDQGHRGGGHEVKGEVIDQGRPPSLLPVFVFSKSPGKNVLEFELKRSNATSMSSTVAKVNLYLYVWKRPDTRRPRRNRRRSKNRRFIKLRVFQVDERNRKGKRIAELRKRVHSSHWHRLGLPVSLVRSMWQAHNGTLRIRVKCKRCNRKVQLVMPSNAHNCSQKLFGKKARKKPGASHSPISPTHPPSSPRSGKKNRGLKLKKGSRARMDRRCRSMAASGHVPFMVIENKAGGWPESQSHSRSARRRPDASSSVMPVSPVISSPLSSSPRNVSSRRSRSAPESAFVQAGLSADGPPPAVAVQEAKQGSPAWRGSGPGAAEDYRLSSPPSFLPTKTRHKRSVSEASSSSQNPAPTRICNPHPRHRACCVLAVPVDPTEFDTGVSIVAPSTLTLTTCDGQCRNNIRHNRRRSRVRGGRRRGGGGSGGKRRKSRQWRCEPTDTQALDIWYFDHNHNLAHASLPGMLVTQCGCRRN